MLLRTLILLACLAAAGCSSPSIIANRSIQLGDAMNNANRYEEAIVNYNKYLDVSPALGLYRNPKMEADVCRKLAHAYSTQGDYTRAIVLLKKAARTDSAAANTMEWIEDNRQLGAVYTYTGNYPLALTFLTKSLQLNEGMAKSVKETKRLSIADTHLSLSQLHLSSGNYKEAESNARAAMTLYENISGETAGIIEASLILGTLFRDKALPDEALKQLMASRTMASQHRLNTSRQDQAIGELYLMKGNIEEAIRYKLEALKQAERSNIKPQIVVANMRIGDVYQQFGDKNNAQKYYRKALEIQESMGGEEKAINPSLKMRLGDVQEAYNLFEKSGSGIGSALVCVRLGEMRYEEKKLDSALYFFEKAKGYFQTMHNREGLARIKLAIAKVETDRQNFPAALSMLREASAIAVQPDFQWQIIYNKGIIHEKRGEADSALFAYQKAIDVIEEMRANLTVDEFKALYASNKTEVYNRVIMLLLSSQKSLRGIRAEDAVTLAFEYNERARSRTFLDMMGNRKIQARNKTDEGLLEQEQLLRLKMLRLAKELNRDDGTLTSDLLKKLQTTQEEHLRLTQQIKLSNAAYSSVISVQPPSLSEMQSALDDRTVMLEYWLGNDKLVIWAVSRSRVTHQVVNLSRAALRKDIIGCRNLIASQIDDRTDQFLEKLYTQLVQPVEVEIKKFSNVIIVPHGPLHFLPFHALRNRDKKYWIESHIISFAPSGAVLYFSKKEQPGMASRFLGVALGETAIGSLPGLPGTRIEISQLSQLYTEYDHQVGNTFTETFFKEKSPAYGYLHIATHAVFNPHQPLYSYLLMSDSEHDDGQMTVNEIFDLSIKSKLVTLSACETGLGEVGEGDEFTGMSRAFLYAGAPVVVVSLWKVDDASTSWLMTRFHQYLQSGFSSAEALTNAQRDFLNQQFDSGASRKGIKQIVMDAGIHHSLSERKNTISKKPYYWAPFVLVGNGSVK
jgi:CHAT domain-containing protein/predicted negative regulator of RcsB-dependent stress response